MAWWLWPVEWRLDLAVLVFAVALDALLGEPPNGMHPVALFGRMVNWLERRAPTSGMVRQFVAGAAVALLASSLFAAVAGWLAYAGLQAGEIVYVIVGAILLKSTFSVRLLVRSVQRVGERLAARDTEGARSGIARLVSRKTEQLSQAQIASAAVETMAENVPDSFLAPWFAFACFGIPGAFAYRAVNTLDSMIGFRGRYEYLGKASARLDDLLNLIPARIGAALTLLAGKALSLSFSSGLRVLQSDHGLTASPNSGWTMSAMAGLLNVSLEKPGYYRLGGGRREPEAADVFKAARVCVGVAVLGLALTIGVLFLRHGIKAWL